MTPPEDLAVRALCDQLLATRDGGGLATVTWLNHHTALGMLDGDRGPLRAMDYVGPDGLLLAGLVGARGARTSADLVVPALLPRTSGARVALIGGRPDTAAGAVTALTGFLPTGGTVVGVRDGYDGLPRGRALARWLAECAPDVVLIGLGGGLQELVALETADALPAGLVLTCGGFLDQVQLPRYYPSWAYRLRLNWAVRLAREPGRLWRRYSTEATAAFRRREDLQELVGSLPGWHRYLGVCAPDEVRDRAAGRA